MAKETQVFLFSAILNEKRAFNISHAQRVLDLQKKNGGDWELKDEKFMLKNGTIQHRDTGKAKKPEEQSSDNQSD